MTDTGPDRIKKLKLRRGQVKSELTRFETFLRKLDTENPPIDQLQVRYESIQSALFDFKTIQAELEEVLVAENTYDQEISAQNRSQFEDKYFELIAKAKNMLKVPSSSTQSDRVLSDTTPLTAKLPRLTLKEFSGHYSEWQGFRDTFLALVHNNKSLSKIEKFYYLQASLKGEAAQVIASLNISDSGYDTAMGLLTARYENKKAIINSHIKEIFELPVLSKESFTNLRKFSDTFLKNYRALESLGESVDTWDTMLLFLLISKLDFNTKKDWENSTKDVTNPKIADFIKFIMQRCQMLEALSSKPAGVGNVDSSHKKMNTTKSFYSSTSDISCPICSEKHFVYACKKLKDMSVSSRYDEIKRLNLCINCLRSGHKVSECRSGGCKTCSKKHNTLLHLTQKNKQDESNSNGSVANSESKNTQSNHTALSHCVQSTMKSFVILSTALVYVHGPKNRRLSCRVLLDSASQSNFVTRKLVDKLNLPVKKIDMPVAGINQIKTNISQQVNIEISSMHNNFKTKLSFLVISSITDLTPQNSFNISNLNIPNELALADPDFNVAAEVDMLIGASVFYELLCVGQIKLGKDLPLLQKTLLGWVVAGNLPMSQLNSASLVSKCLFTDSELNKQIEQFWLTEEVIPDSHSKLSQEEAECERHYIENFSRNTEGRFVVKLPLKSNWTDLGESEQTALNRLYSIERKLAKNPDLRRQYEEFLREYENLGHMSELVHDITGKTPVYYMPHHCVEKPDSTTTKVRVVFDASSKTSSNISLNDVLKVGPLIQKDLFSILIRFRKHNFVLIGDLAKMYRQILVHDDHRRLQRIIWRNDPSEEVKYYQLNTITYGTASASFLATRCLKQIAIDNETTNSVIGNIISNDFYMDDLLTGTSDSESLSSIRNELTSLLSKYGFEIRKFQSNDQTLIGNTKDNLDSEYVISEDSSIKTLGVSWIPNLDCFEYKSQNTPCELTRVTKRSILSFISKVFDPLGLLGAITIRAKLIIQGLWQLKIGWDEALPAQLHTQWVDFYNQFLKIKQIRIPRHVIVIHPISIQIHAFCDASEKAYAGALYVRSVDIDGHIECHLLTAKSRVAPLKTVSLPRLELCGALLVSKLLFKCVSELDLEVDKVYFWTDSTIVLCWLAKESRTWKTFVSNRVSEIQQLTNINDWNYIASEHNPADVISRGANLHDLINSRIWWHGPQFLSEPSDKWPDNSNIIDRASTPQSVLEYKQPLLSFCCKNDFNLFHRFSELNKLIRVTAYCLRFIKNCKATLAGKQTGNLSREEINLSTDLLIRLSQGESFPDDLHSLRTKGYVSNKSKLKSLSPFLDSQGLLRVGGRLQHSNLTFAQKHPSVLAATHPFTKLIVKHEHERSMHAGSQTTLAHIRQRFWPINGKHIVRSHIRRCVRCFRTKPTLPNAKMGDLPSPRITQPSRPFVSTAVDYAGPFEMKDGKLRSRKIIKGYVCVFVCLATKAVHLELVTDLSTNGFLSLLKRFVSRRGVCADLYSDNATNFVGANNELKSIQSIVEANEFSHYLSQSQINWHFIPARSPHFGGLWEAAVKSFKHHFNRVIKGIHLSYEEFYTFLTQAEAILNSRPIIPLSQDPNDLEALTPAHFLIGQPLTAIAESNSVVRQNDLKRRYQHLQLMRHHFWSQWSKQYLHNLQQRTKWQFDKSPDLQIGALVLLKDDNCPPMYWPMGRIEKLHPGSDDRVRVVTVKCKNKSVKRALTQVALLPLDY